MEESLTTKSAAKRRRSEMDSGLRSSSGRRGRRHSTMGLTVEENGVLLEVNRMELRSGRNLVKYSEDSSELTAENSTLVENTQTPKRKLSQTKKNRRKSMEFVNEQSATPTTPIRKSIQAKRTSRKSVGKENEKPAIAFSLVEGTQDIESSQSKMNKKKSNCKEENELATTFNSVDNASDGTSSQTKMSRKSNFEEENGELELSDTVLTSQECEVSSTHMIQNVEINDDLSVPISDQSKEDVAEILNNTFEVADEDSILQTPFCKRSVRFAAAVETRRRTASFSNSTDDTPKCSTPVSVNTAQRRSEHKGTPHPSAKKRPSSILKVSSSKKLPSSSKDKSLSRRSSARKMPDFSSIHKAQFEKMESIDDFSRRRHKCARKLEAETCHQAVDDSQQVQPKQTAVVKPVERTAVNALSQIPMVPQNTSKPGTRSSTSSHIPIVNFRVLTEKNFDARRSTPYKFTSRPSLTKTGSNSRPKPVNNSKPQRITYEQAKAAIQNKKPLAAVKRDAEKLENRSILKGVRLNRRFELHMQHRKLNM